jgi:phytoene desaturase
VTARTVAIVGGGLGGLSAAIHLASAGHRVRLFEKNPTLGGKLAELRADGFTFDLGPSVLTLPDVFRDLFAVAGSDFDEQVPLERVDPVCRYHFADGSMFDLPDGLDRQLEAVARFSPREVDGYRRFARYARELYDASADSFLFRPFGDISGLGGREGLVALRQLHRLLSPRSLDGLVRRFFRDPRLVQIFNRFATYNGSSPYTAPATFAVIPHVEHALGAYRVRGGMYRLAEAEAELARRVGVEIDVGREVVSVDVRAGRAEGVRLGDGERVGADAVIVNADAVGAYERLLPPDADPRTRRRLLAQEPSSSALIVLLGVSRRLPELAHHNIYFSADYRAEFDAIFRRRVPPEDPTVYVCAPSRSDSARAPAGGEALFVMVNMPASRGGERWPEAGEALAARMRDRIARAGTAIRETELAHETLMTPADIEARYGARLGAIYGPSSNTRLQAFLRPPNRARGIRGLFFAGGGSHPGGGMPLVTLSGRIAAALVQEYMRGK